MEKTKKLGFALGFGCLDAISSRNKKNDKEKGESWKIDSISQFFCLCGGFHHLGDFHRLFFLALLQVFWILAGRVVSLRNNQSAGRAHNL